MLGETMYSVHVAATVIPVAAEMFPEPALLQPALGEGNAG
jgi:hypothetical protein